MSAKKKASVSEIARIANVSPATVSRAQNHPETVKPETIRKIREVMEQLGCSPDEIPAGGSPTGSLVIVCLHSFSNPFFINVVEGIKAACNSHGFRVLIYPDVISRSTMSRFNEMRQHVNIGGIITLSTTLDSVLLEALDNFAPVVQCCEYNTKSYVPYVGIDNFSAARKATEYLISTGRKKIALINGTMTHTYAQERLRGFEYALLKNNITIPASWKLSLPESSYEISYSAVSQLLNSPNRPNAIFAVSDIYAIAALRAARRFGLRVPQDLSIMGFDNIEITTMVSPTISTISQPCFQLGFTAGETLAERIRNPERIPHSILLDTELVLRESSPVVDKNALQSPNTQSAIL